MGRRDAWLVVAMAVLASPGGVAGAEGPGTIPNGPGAFALPVVVPIDDRALAREVDRALEARWAVHGIAPAPPADDAEFLRRVALDVAGRIPPVSEVRAFLDGDDPEKRRRLVERLLASHAYVNHTTNTWRALLIPEAGSSAQASIFAGDFEAWLRKQIAAGAGYDAIVRALLTADATRGQSLVRTVNGAIAEPSPFGFLAAKEGKPENLAASSARVFLGIRIECAQCHDHPFATWKRDEFWGLAAFFVGVQRQGPPGGIFRGTDSPYSHLIEVPGTKRIVKAAFLDGRELDWTGPKPARARLADWIVAKENPYFARAAANRVWAQLFGVGLVDPVDDMGAGAEASHPELLDLLADQLAAHGFDFRYLIRALTSSRAYQLTSAGGSPSVEVARLFERMPVRGLTPEQLYDSLAMAAGLPREQAQPGVIIRTNNTPRGEFLERFAGQEERPTDRRTSILQALTLMNGRLVDDATTPDRGATLSAVAGSPFLDTAARIEVLYLAALTRRPRPDELARLVPYVDGGGPAHHPTEALADIFWSLLGSAEFAFNH